MRRRSFLAACGAASFSGCLLASAGDDPPVGQVDCQPTADERSSGTASEPTSVDGHRHSFQYDARNSGYNPDASGPQACPGTLWSYRVGLDGYTNEINLSPSTAPVIDDGSLYVCDNKNALYALDAATGSERWTMDLRGPFIYGPAFADGTLYLTSNRHLVAINVESRRESWARVEPTPYLTIDESNQGWMRAAPAVADGRVFAGTFNGLFCAFDADSGDMLWHRIIPARNPTWTGEDTPAHEPSNVFRGQPAVHDGVVYVANDNGRLYAFDAESGEDRWVHQPGDRLDYAPTVHDGTAYVTGSQGIYAVSVADGTREWTFGRADDLITRGSPAIAGDTLVAVAGDSQPARKLVALDARSGEVLWRTSRLNTSWGSSASIAGETVVVGMRGGLIAVDLATGDLRWTVRSGEVSSEPILVDDMVFAEDSDGYVYALR